MVRTGTSLGDETVYEAASRFREFGMRSRQSVFAPPRPVWSLASFQELEREFASVPDTSGGSFESKLRTQLGRCSDEARLLMAELLALHLLITNTIGKDKKLETIGIALDTMTTPVPVPADLHEAFENGFVNPGAYFNTGRPAQLRYLVRVGSLLSSRPFDELTLVLDDPWRFRETLEPLSEQGSATQRQALLHLLFPVTFEAIVSTDHQQKIVGHFAPLTGCEPTGDLDRDLIELRRRLEPRYGEGFDFYSPRLRALWEKGADPWAAVTRWAAKIYATDGFEESERDYKLKAVESFGQLREALDRGGEAFVEPLRRLHRNSNNNLVDFRAADDFLTWAEAEPERARDVIVDLLGSSEPLRKRVQRFADAISARVGSPGNRTAQAAYLLMASDPTGFPMYRPEPFKSFLELVGANHRRPEGDRYAQAVQTCDELAAELKDRENVDVRDRLDAQALIWAITKAQPDGPLLAPWSQAERNEFFLWRDGPSGAPAAPTPPAEPANDGQGVVAATSFDERLSAAAAKTHLSVPYLRDLCDLLLASDKKQMVLYGPPGTGKTFVAQQLAYVISGVESEIVQFHPSTTYEDFFEGIRPVTTDTGGIQYRVVPGPLAALAAEADANRSRPYVLIIDELNRANLPKVLGELLFLFEYRDVGVRTLYRGDGKFRLPANLYVIATMNTVDRSVALIDAAMRRRFHFVSFYPDEPELSDVLGSVCSADEAWVEQLVKRVNADLLAEFGSRDYLLGWSHFINADRSPAGMERVWRHTIEPLIDDHLFGQPDRMRRFRWASVYRRHVQGDASEESEPAGDDNAQLDD